MKKLILMLLVLAGGVTQLSATSTLMRIYAERQKNWGDHVYIYANYWDGSANQEVIPYTQMTYLSSSSGGYMFYIDVTLDNDKVTDAMGKYGLKFKFSNNSGTDTAENQFVDANFLTENHLFYIYDSDGYKNSHATFTGYAIANGYTAASNTLLTLSQDGLELTGTLDLSSEVTDTEFWVFPAILSSGYYQGTLAIRPSGSSNYALSDFTNYSSSTAFGDTYKWTESAHQKYNVTIDLSTGQFTFAPYITASLNANGYGTFGCSFADFKIPATDTDGGDVSAYYAASADDHTVTMNKLAASTDVNKADGLFLIGTASKTLKFTPATTSPSSVSSMMKPGDGTTTIASGASGPYRYVFSGDTFKKLSTTGRVIPEGKAYLESAELLANEFTLSFDDGTTSIRVINTDATTVESNDIYNVAGQRVVNPTKGLYIVNGKKVIK